MSVDKIQKRKTRHEPILTYHVKGVGERGSGRNFGQDRYNHLYGLHDFVASLKMPKCLGLILQNGSDGLDRLASLEFDCEGMLC